MQIRSISPGPFTLAEAASTIPIKDANGKTIASVKYRANDLADARLFAASYELIALAKRCKEYLKHPDGHHLPAGEWFALNEELRSVISKVEA